MTYNIGEIIGKYVELRDRKAALSKQHDAEMATLTGPMQHIENYLLHQMNTAGVTQLKGETGTAFKHHTVSVQMKDSGEFKRFVFEPALQSIRNHLAGLGIDLPPVEIEALAMILRDLPRWDVVDFRSSKKGVQEYQEQTQQQVPGVAVNTVVIVNIRRA